MPHWVIGVIVLLVLVVILYFRYVQAKEPLYVIVWNEEHDILRLVFTTGPKWATGYYLNYKLIGCHRSLREALENLLILLSYRSDKYVNIWLTSEPTKAAEERELPKFQNILASKATGGKLTRIAAINAINQMLSK